jgi:hypothetical protein
MLIPKECVARRKKKHGAKEVPLKFEPTIRAAVKEFANDCVARTYYHNNKADPNDEAAHNFIQSINTTGQTEQWFHG